MGLKIPSIWIRHCKCRIAPLESLIKKLAHNKEAQDSIAIANEQIKKVIEMQKEKQRKVN